MKLKLVSYNLRARVARMPGGRMRFFNVANYLRAYQDAERENYAALLDLQAINKTRKADR